MKINTLPWSPELMLHRIGRVARWAVVLLLGVALWLIGLGVLGVPADLPLWRHVAGAAMLATACFSWRRA